MSLTAVGSFFSLNLKWSQALFFGFIFNLSVVMLRPSSSGYGASLDIFCTYILIFLA